LPGAVRAAVAADADLDRLDEGSNAPSSTSPAGPRSTRRSRLSCLAERTGPRACCTIRGATRPEGGARFVVALPRAEPPRIEEPAGDADNAGMETVR
jgi:hypothetical protein